MNRKQLTLAAALLISVAGFAQKDELKSLKKIYDRDAMTAKDIVDYRAALDKTAPVMTNASAEERAYFAFYKASAPVLELSTAASLANPQAALNNITVANIKDYATAATAVIELEKPMAKKVLTEDIKATVAAMKPKVLGFAVKLADQKKFIEGADVLYAMYQLDKADADNLYYAANYALNGKDMDAALRYYNELRDINYSGEGTLYFATSVVNNQEQSFPSEVEMYKYVGLKTHTKPRKELVPSKRGEIYKNIALILMQQNKTDEARAAIAKARVENPDDTSLMMTEADLYLKLNEMDNYRKVISAVLAKNPNDAVLNYNLGVVTLNGGQPAEAEQYFLRAIELDPKGANAYVNMAAIKLKADEKLVEDMNKLGSSAADNKKYEALKAERNKVFRSALPYLEKAYELDPESGAVIDNLMSVYNYLEMTDKYRALKAKRK